MIVSSTPEPVLLSLQWPLAVSLNRASLSESWHSILVRLNPFSMQLFNKRICRGLSRRQPCREYWNYDGNVLHPC